MNRTVVLHIEGVPNPDAMKFVLENGILTDEPYEFKNLVDAENSPLVRRLMMLRYVDRVLMYHNYIAVVKDNKYLKEWGQETLFELRSLIQQHLAANEPILYFGAKAITHEKSEDAIVSIIRDVLDKKIRPAAREDGGDIVFESYSDGVLNLSMLGACHHCPYAKQTMEQGVEKVMKSLVPEVKKVTATANNLL
ncbi:MAG: NifU family protein [Bacteroidota bacterium]